MGQGYTETGEKKKEKKRRERSAKQWILEGALFFHFSPSSPFLSLSLSPDSSLALSSRSGRLLPPLGRQAVTYLFVPL